MTQDTKWFDGDLVIQANFEDMAKDILLMEKGQGPFSRIVELALNEAVMVLAKLIVDNTPSNTGAPVDDIKLWVLRKQLQWYRDGTPMTVDQMAWALARHIGKEGTEAVEMYKKGLAASKPTVDIIWERMLDDIIREWGRWEHNPPAVR
jgi:hypothetical protein